MDKESLKAQIRARIQEVRERMEAAAARVGRDPARICLVAVTKTVEPERILAAYELGLRHFGENRVQEAAAKIPVVNTEAREPPITWHMVGHLQRNKAKRAVRLFDFLHSLDSVRLALELEKRCAALDKTLPVLLEVNVSGEATKYGFAPEELFEAVEVIATLPHLRIQGLMTIAPIVPQAEEARPFFRRLRELRDELQRRFPGLDWHHLSMGMTDDFEVAIEEGATMVRLGRAIFGERR